MNTTELYESTPKSELTYTSSADVSADKLSDFIDDVETIIEYPSKVPVQSIPPIGENITKVPVESNVSIVDNLSKVPVQSNASINDDAPFKSGDENGDKSINTKKFDVIPIENNSPIDDDTSGDNNGTFGVNDGDNDV